MQLREIWVAYTVNYQDANGKTLADSQTFYGNAGDKPVVAYKYIENYIPQALALTKTLSDNESKNVFTFTYTPGETDRIVETTTTVTTIVPGPTTTTTTTGTTGTGTTGTGTTEGYNGTTGTGTTGTTGTGTGTAANGTNAANNAAGDNTANGANTNAGGTTDNQNNGQDADNQDNQTTDIPDNQVPETLVDLDDEETPKSNIDAEDGSNTLADGRRCSRWYSFCSSVGSIVCLSEETFKIDIIERQVTAGSTVWNRTVLPADKGEFDFG